MTSSVVFCHRSFNHTETQVFFSDPLHKDRHTFSQSSLSPCRNSKRMGTFPSFPRDSATINAEPLLMPNFQPEVVGFCSGNSSRLNSGSQGGAFIFFQQILLSRLKNLSSPGRPSRTGVLRLVVLRPAWKCACGHLVAPSSPTGKPIRLQSTMCFPSAT